MRGEPTNSSTGATPFGRWYYIECSVYMHEGQAEKRLQLKFRLYLHLSTVKDTLLSVSLSTRLVLISFRKFSFSYFQLPFALSLVSLPSLQGATCAILEHLEVDPHCCGFSGSGGAATSASDSSASAAAAAPSSGGGAPGAAAAAASVVGQDQGLGVRLFNAEALQRYTLMCAQQFPDGILY